MTMLIPNDVPDAPDWSTEPKPWDAAGCCPATCSGICDRLDIPDTITLGSE